MPSPNRPVLVLGCTHGGLAVIRSLGKRGIPVIAVSHDEDDFGLYSRYAQDFVICPHPEDTKALKDFLLERANEWQDGLILETTDYYAVALSEHKQSLLTAYRMITPNPDVTNCFIAKDKTYNLAKAAGVPYPIIIDADDIPAYQHLQYPVMIKPERSHEFVRVFNKKLFIAQSPDELQHYLHQIKAHDLKVVIQEIIIGDDSRSLESLSVYIDTGGELRGELFNVKIRQIPPMWGVMRVGQSISPIDDIRDYSMALLRAIDFRGFADIEFKRDQRDGLPKLIEVNIRLPQNLQMMIASGIDFPWIIYQDLILGQPVSASKVKPTYYIDLIHDLGYSFAREPRKALNLPSMFTPYMSSSKTFPVFDIDDMQPFYRLIQSKLNR